MIFLKFPGDFPKLISFRSGCYARNNIQRLDSRQGTIFNTWIPGKEQYSTPGFQARNNIQRMDSRQGTIFNAWILGKEQYSTPGFKARYNIERLDSMQGTIFLHLDSRQGTIFGAWISVQTNIWSLDSWHQILLSALEST